MRMWLLQNTLFFFISFSFSCFAQTAFENERTALTISEEDFQDILLEREQGRAGFHKNIEPSAIVPALDSAVQNWADLSTVEKERLKHKQEEMFREGKITMIVLAGGEATRFGGPKTFVTVSEELGEFLEIKAANLNWMHQTYQTKVPLYILSSEKRLGEFKHALAERKYYGLEPGDFRWYVQGTIDTFIPTEAELRAQYQGKELEQYLKYAREMRKANPDGIYRFNGVARKIPPGHFDAIASFIISGLLSEALSLGIEFAPLVNIDNLQAILKNDGMIAYFADKGDDVGFLLAEKNLTYTIKNRTNDKVIQPKLTVRLRERILSFDGKTEWIDTAEQGSYIFSIDPEKKTVRVHDVEFGMLIETENSIKPEIGGTLVQLSNGDGLPIGKPLLKEGFELKAQFDHANAGYFNTNTVILNLKSLLRLLEVSEERLAKMNFEERSRLVREKLIKPLKLYFEFKNHEVEGEFPLYGVVKEGKTKIPVSQATRILLQACHIKDAKIGYLFAPRNAVFAPVKEPEDKKSAADRHAEELKNYLR